MAADITDKARKSYSLLTKSLSAGISDVDTTIPFNNVTNIPTDTAVDFIIDRVDSNGTPTPTLRELCKGVVSGSNLINCVRGVHGTTAQSHLSGAVVEFIVSASAHNDLIDLILADHSQSGTHEIATNYDPANPTLETQKWVGVASAVNEITVTNAATGNFPTISATGEADTGIDFENSEGEEILKLDAIASAVNEITIKNAITTAGPVIEATGGDSNIPINITPKGTGNIIHNGPFTNKYCFRAYDSAGTTLTDGVASAISFGTEVYDYNNNFASNAYTAPVSGVYHFDFAWVMGTIATGVDMYASIAINGTQYIRGARNIAGSNTGASISADIPLTAGQVVTFEGFQNSAGNETTTTGNDQTWCSGHLVHAT